jgi:hypothetical protein
LHNNVGSSIVGVEEKDSRIIAMPGIDAESGFKQRIVDWCASAVNPPLYVEVSDAIPAPAGNGKVCYVVRVPESDVAPHFLNGRNGLWVRTGEFSRRFDAKLATEAEVRQLFDRRRLIIERRSSVIQRARMRFANYLNTRRTPEGNLIPGPRLMLSVVPVFPAKALCEQEKLESCMAGSRMVWRQRSFASDIADHVCQQESLVVLDAARPYVQPFYLEANVWGFPISGMNPCSERALLGKPANFILNPTGKRKRVHGFIDRPIRAADHP